MSDATFCIPNIVITMVRALSVADDDFMMLVSAFSKSQTSS